MRYGGITNASERHDNLAAQCVLQGMEDFGAGGFEGFLNERRKLMAWKLRDYCQVVLERKISRIAVALGSS